MTLAVHAESRRGSRTAPGPAAPVTWQRRYAKTLALVDATGLGVAMAAAVLIRFGGHSAHVAGVTYPALAAAMVAAWMLCLVSCRAYEMRFLGIGTAEYRRVGTATLRITAVASFACVALRVDIARGFLAAALPLGAVALLAGRYLARRILHRMRTAGRCLHRVVVVGNLASSNDLLDRIARDPGCGFDVVGVHHPVTGGETSPADDASVALGVEDVVALAHDLRADTIAVTAFDGLAAPLLRRLAWQLEGTDIDLVVAPALTDVAGPRISIRPVAGLPLLHVEEPDIRGGRQLAKEIVERAIALLMFAACAPVLAGIAIAIRLHSPGPALFRQTRVGRGGREFTVYKLRTMRADAEALLADLLPHNEAADGLLFKIRRDPRITRIGGFLRRTSLDELPQLWNVVKGDMALVGPRPPLPSEVNGYADDVRRRLLVKPGITGLWQVSGRSDLSWQDSVRLDLYYVENWSFALDAQILLRTLHAVVHGKGAY